MDNITHLVPVTKSQCVITLDPFQYNYYQQSSIEIHSPDGEHLETLGCDIQKENLFHNHVHLQDQMCLVESLLGNINKDIELPARASRALADLLFRMQEFCERNSK